MSVSFGSFGVTPSLLRSMPIPVLAKMRFPSIVMRLLVEPICIPPSPRPLPLKAMTLPAPGVVPPIVAPVTAVISIPPNPLPRGVVPVTSVPIELPCTSVPGAVMLWRSSPNEPLPDKRFPAPMTSPPITVFGAAPILIPRSPFRSAAVPVTFVPTKFPWMRLPEAAAPVIKIPERLFPEMIFRADAVVPPIRLLAVSIQRPAFPLPSCAVPVALVPIKFP